MAKPIAKGSTSLQQRLVGAMGTKVSPFVGNGMAPRQRQALTNKAPATVTLKRGNTGK